MNTIIVSNSELVTSSAAEEARKLRDELLAQARALPLVTDPKSQEEATSVLRALRSFYKMVEAGREAAKAPVLKLSRGIDALADDLYGEVEREGKRVGQVLGVYDLEQKRIAEEKRQEAIREERRVREEAAAKERAEEERQRKLAAQAREEVERQKRQAQAEADAKAARARTEAGRERAAKEAEAAKARLEEQAKVDAAERVAQSIREQAARDAEETRRVAQIRSDALAVASARPKDTATSEKIMFEVEDAQALYEAAPYLVTLVPNVAAIRSALKGMRGEQKLPGVKHWREASTITRG